MLPSGKRLHNYGKSPSLRGKITISMTIFNSKLLVITTGWFVCSCDSPVVHLDNHPTSRPFGVEDETGFIQLVGGIATSEDGLSADHERTQHNLSKHVPNDPTFI